MSRVAIIGAGIGGMATAIRLAAMGHRVSVFEQQASVGGKLNELRRGGFRFDMGPSLFTLPSLVDELFDLAGGPSPEGLTYQRLEVITKYFFANGKTLNAWANSERMAQEAHDVLREPTVNLLNYLKSSEELYRLTSNTFIFSPFPTISSFFTANTLELILNPSKLRAFRSVHGVNLRAFSSPEMVQLFDRYATYNGSNPYLAPGTLTMIPHLEHGVGAYFPQGGMYSIASGMHNLARSLGVSFHLGCCVSRVEHKGAKAIGLNINGLPEGFDCVVNNTDIFTAYPRLLPQLQLAPRYSGCSPSSSALIFYWGVAGQYPQLDMHNILFSEDYKQEFETMASGNISNDPTVYIFISSKQVAGDAPPLHENWFVMVNAPTNSGQDWEELRLRARGSILTKIRRVLGIDLEPKIVQEDVLDPVGIENRTGSFRGALYGISSNSRMAAFRRHPNRHPRIKNLFMVGGSVHPGGGIPLCLASAKIVAKYFQRI